MDDGLIIYVPLEELKSVGGRGIRNILNGLIKDGLLRSYTDVIKLNFSKDQAIHIQTCLEFYGIRSKITSYPKQTRKDDSK